MEILNKIIIASKANCLTINDYFSITRMPFNDIFSTYTLIHFNCESYVNTPLLVILNDYIITIYTKANTKKSKMKFKYIYSYRFKSNNTDFYVSYNYQFDNIVTLHFSLNELKGRYENTLMIEFADKKDSKEIIIK